MKTIKNTVNKRPSYCFLLLAQNTRWCTRRPPGAAVWRRGAPSQCASAAASRVVCYHSRLRAASDSRDTCVVFVTTADSLLKQVFALLWLVSKVQVCSFKCDC